MTKKQIIKTIRHLGKASVTNIIGNLPEKRSRQWVSTLLNQLSKEGALVRTKTGRNVFYMLPAYIDLVERKTRKKFTNKSLDESVVYEKLKSSLTILINISEDLNSILYYAFTEMLNNAIEHSQSKFTEILFEETNDAIIFEVQDKGIGVYKNIMQKKKLSSELEAIQELIKGKTTTLPHSHSGEGIFFTSKIADIFILDSFGYRLRIDNLIKDVFVEKIKSFKGTKVRFKIKKRTTKHLNDVFHQYESEPGSHAFDKTKIYVKLFKAGTIYISRSQARRLMSNLEKFKLVILDFKGIKTIGQAFADEVFRVFTSKHPQVKIQSVNKSEAVEFMINRTH